MHVSIVGLGWLGEPLAQLLHPYFYRVRGSTTSALKANRLSGEGIAAQVLLGDPLPEGEDLERVFASEVLVVNIPPALKNHGEDHYLD